MTPPRYTIYPINVKTDVPEDHASDLPLFFHSCKTEEIKQSSPFKGMLCVMSAKRKQTRLISPHTVSNAPSG